jgi:8-amino-7-oxononanoate synthase
MPALDDILQQKNQLLAAGLKSRTLHATHRSAGAQAVRAGVSFISFSCNDYLGLSQHPQVVEAARTAISEYGAGAGASRLVTGECPLYAELEAAIASAKGQEAALVFGSGYLANIGVIPALVGRGDLILADKWVHACMLDGARLSGATVHRFAHNNLSHLEFMLEQQRAEHSHCLILTETVFSMDGDRAPLPAIAALAKRYNAWLMTDDAHGFGVVGAENPAEIQMGTLSKAVGGYGGYVCGSQALRDYLISASRSLIFTTALPPSVLAANIAALRIIAAEPQRVALPLERAQQFTQALGLPLAQSAIVPLVLGENDKALAASARLAELGYLVAAIRPPTVPENTARLRFAFCADHTPNQVQALADIIRAEGWV